VVQAKDLTDNLSGMSIANEQLGEFVASLSALL